MITFFYFFAQNAKQVLRQGSSKCTKKASIANSSELFSSLNHNTTFTNRHLDIGNKSRSINIAIDIIIPTIFIISFILAMVPLFNVTYSKITPIVKVG